MNNLEKFKEKILSGISNTNECVDCMLCGLRKSNCNSCNGCEECLIDSIKWLAEEYKEPIKLSKVEYDLIWNCFESEPTDEEALSTWWAIKGMKEKGYFKNVDLNMTLAELVERAVIENE